MKDLEAATPPAYWPRTLDGIRMALAERNELPPAVAAARWNGKRLETLAIETKQDLLQRRKAGAHVGALVAVAFAGSPWDLVMAAALGEDLSDREVVCGYAASHGKLRAILRSTVERHAVDDLIWKYQDGYGEPGLTPVQGWDWSGIRDSSAEGFRAMRAALVVFLKKRDWRV